MIPEFPLDHHARLTLLALRGGSRRHDGTGLGGHWRECCAGVAPAGGRSAAGFTNSAREDRRDALRLFNHRASSAGSSGPLNGKRLDAAGQSGRAGGTSREKTQPGSGISRLFPLVKASP